MLKILGLLQQTAGAVMLMVFHAPLWAFGLWFITVGVGAMVASNPGEAPK